MSKYFYYQVKGGEEAWKLGLAELRETIIENERPRYSTILDLDLSINEDTTKAEMDAIKYRGDMYFDFDSDDIEDVIVRVNKFIKKLEDIKMNLDNVSFYATGKKGFHATIPQECFMSKPPAKGIQSLPAIYKEIAFQLYVDTMDIRVYSARKGRMFRTVNVERENGKFKVQVTPEEIRDMTEDIYLALTSEPRPLLIADKPKLNAELATMYAEAEQKVIAAFKRRGDSKRDIEALAKFKGQFPPTLLKIMNGEGVADAAGFNKVAMQLGITANGLNKNVDEYIKLCAGLIENHISDGTRYNTPKKREAELRRMFEYTQDNVCYTFSAGAVKNLLKPGEQAADLSGYTEAQGEISGGADAETDESLYGGVTLTSKGIFKTTEDGITQLCDLGFTGAAQLLDIHSGATSGFEADVTFRNEKKGRKYMSLDVFSSKSKFQSLVHPLSGIYSGSDNQVTSILGRLRDMAIKSGDVVYVVHKEGLDLIKYGTPEGPKMEMIWTAVDNVYSLDKRVKYIYQSSLNRQAMFDSDLYNAPDVSKVAKQGTESEKQTIVDVIEALLNLNEPYVVGNLLGWMTSCFHRQIYNEFYHQFPLCQVIGQAGSGKSSSAHALLHLFYYMNPPKLTSATGSTKFMIESYMQSSATIPCVLDEYKPKQMSIAKRGELLTVFREAYNQNSFGKGGGSNGAMAADWRDAQQYSYSAPLMFIGEAMEAESAVLERSVTVTLKKSGLAGRDKNIQKIRDNRHVLSSIGKCIVDSAFNLDLPTFKVGFETVLDELRAEAYSNQNDRVLFNVAVVLQGLTVFRQVADMLAGDSRFDEKFKQLYEVVRDTSNHVGTVVMSEAAKVMNSLSYMSRSEMPDSDMGLLINEDYFISDRFVDLNMRNVYVKYKTWCMRRGSEPLYDSEDAFIHGISGFAAVFDRSPQDSVLKTSALTNVIRFDKAKLTTERVEEFK